MSTNTLINAGWRCCGGYPLRWAHPRWRGREWATVDAIDVQTLIDLEVERALQEAGA